MIHIYYTIPGQHPWVESAPALTGLSEGRHQLVPNKQNGPAVEPNKADSDVPRSLSGAVSNFLLNPSLLPHQTAEGDETGSQEKFLLDQGDAAEPQDHIGDDSPVHGRLTGYGRQPLPRDTVRTGTPPGHIPGPYGPLLPGLPCRTGWGLRPLW